nr:EVE domain-containing protein [Ardenticatenales bacterium]
ATARRLLNAGNTSEGFTRLWELGRLDLTVEAIVLKPEFASLFSEEERTRARERLREVRYTPSWDQPASAATPPPEASSPAPPPSSLIERLAHARANVQDTPRAWVFQANPEQFDLAGAVQALEQLHWTTRQHVAEIHAGDIVYLWEAGPEAGIVAVAHVLTDPAPLPDTASRAFWQNPSEADEVEARVALQIDLLLPERLTRDELRADPALQNMLILRQQRGANFPLTAEEAATLEALIEELLNDKLEEPSGHLPRSSNILSYEEWLTHVIAANPIVREAAEELPGWLQEVFRDELKLTFRVAGPRRRLWVSGRERTLALFSFNRQSGLYIWLADPNEELVARLQESLSDPKTVQPRKRPSAHGWRFLVNNENDYVLAKNALFQYISGALTMPPMTPIDATYAARLKETEWPTTFEGPAFVLIHTQDNEYQSYGESYSFTNYAGGAYRQLSDAVEAMERGGPAVQVIFYRPQPSHAFTGWARVVGVDKELGEKKNETRWTLRLEHHEFPSPLRLKQEAAFLMGRLPWLAKGLVVAFRGFSIRPIPPEDFQTIIQVVQGALTMTPNDAAYSLLAEAGSALSTADLLQRAHARGWVEGTNQMSLASALRRDARFLDLGEGLWRLADEAMGSALHAATDAHFWRIHVPRHFWAEAREAGAIGISWPIESTNASVKRFERIRPGDRVVAYVQQGTIGGVGVVTGGPVDVRLAGRAGFPPGLFGDDYHRRLHVAWSDELAEPVPLLDALKAPEHKLLFDRLRNPNTVIELPRDGYQELLMLLGVADPADEHEGVSRLPDAWPSLATFRDFAQSLPAAPYSATTLHAAALAFGQGVDAVLDEETFVEQFRQLRLLRPAPDGTFRLADYTTGDAGALLRLLALALLLPREGQEEGYDLPARAIVARLQAADGPQPRETFAPRLGDDAARLLAWYAEAGLVQVAAETWQPAPAALAPLAGTDVTTELYNRFLAHLQAELAGTLASDLPPVEGQALQRVTELEARLAELSEELLIDSALVRRILRSLLAGRHVVLSGPPGTGKTELAQRLPTLFWRESPRTFTRLTTDPDQEPVVSQEESRHGYLPVVVTATEDWGVRDVVGGIGPRLGGQGGSLTYNIQHGHLTRAVLRHYENTDDGQRLPESYRRREVRDEAGQRYRGTWLVIDEFTRAPVDAAFGSLLTTLSGGKEAFLAVPAPDGGEVRIPLPADFRIIGTLNSFDRHFLNQISEALKRRFDFIDVSPPPPDQWKAEQGVAAYQALLRLRAKGFEAEIEEDTGSRTLRLGDEVHVFWDAAGYHVEGTSDEAKAALDSFWRLFSVIRLFRQLGTAQVVALYINLFAGRLMEMTWPEALDAALADTLADQLQVLTRDEQMLLLTYLKYAGNDAFGEQVRQLLKQLSPGRRAALLHTLREADEVRQEGESNITTTADSTLDDAQLERLFALSDSLALPASGLFARRLRALVGERGL